MTCIVMRHVSNNILHDINLRVENRDFYVLIGPNGAGKTTLLKTIAGLIPYRGTILFNGEPVDDLPPEKRGVGYMPQTIALFLHMTAEENIMFGPRMHGLSMSDSRRIAKELMEFLGILHVADKYPLMLSGGERKKVALARALAIDSEILLLDEPFTGIQYDDKVEIADVLKGLFIHRGKTIILVTHSIDEAVELGTGFAVMKCGKILYSGGKIEFLQHIDKYLDYINALDCIITSITRHGLAYSDCQGLQLAIPLEEPLYEGASVKVLIPADKIYMSKKKPWPGINVYKARIMAETESSNLYKLELETNKTKVMLKTMNKPHGIGETYIKIPIRHIRVVPAYGKSS